MTDFMKKVMDIKTFIPTLIQVTLVIRGGCVPVNRRVYLKRVKRKCINVRGFSE
jgi:hypothetical protein